MSKKTEPMPIWRQQSPIDLSLQTSLPTALSLDYLVIDYPNADLAGRFEDENFWFDSPPSLTFSGNEAFLERLHIHSPSEHLIDGSCFDFEIHFVNPLKKPTGTIEAVVIGVFFKEKRGAMTPSSIKSLNTALKAAPKTTKKSRTSHRIPGSVNPCDFLPVNRGQYYRYEGSLTTGSFKQTISWFVMPQLVLVAPADVAALKAHAHEGARKVQSLDRRFVLRNFT